MTRNEIIAQLVEEIIEKADYDRGTFSVELDIPTTKGHGYYLMADGTCESWGRCDDNTGSWYGGASYRVDFAYMDYYNEEDNIFSKDITIKVENLLNK